MFLVQHPNSSNVFDKNIVLHLIPQSVSTPPTSSIKVLSNHTLKLSKANLDVASTAYNKVIPTSIYSSSFLRESSSPTFVNQLYVKMSPYQMALHLMPKILSSDANSVSDIINLIAQYDETKDWPRWKQRTLVRKIVDMQNQPLSIKHSVSDTPSQLKSETSSNIDKVVSKLFPLFLIKKVNNPSLTTEEFLKSYQIISDLPYSLQKAINKSLKSSWKSELCFFTFLYNKEVLE